MENVDWNYFDKFDALEDKYLPAHGDGDNMATQAVTAASKLIYKWYNDGDVYDNNYGMDGWCNNISGSANWLYEYIPEIRKALNKICDISYGDEGAYEHILKEVADIIFRDDFLAGLAKRPHVGDAYDEEGPFSFNEYDEYDEDEEW